MQEKLKGKALVADNSASHQLLMMVLMKKIGLNAKLVGDGVAAIEATESENFDIIIMETRMPKINGIDAAKTMRQKGIKVPIIALLSDPYSINLKECLKAGFDSFLQKPITKKSLCDMIRKHLDGKEIDRSMLVSSIAAGQDVSSVIDTYFEEFPEIFDGLNGANDDNDIEIIEELVKELKGASDSDGLGLLRKYADDLEKVMNQTDMDKSHKAADEIYNICLKLIEQQNL